MIVDTSAIVEALLNASEAERIRQRLDEAETPAVGAPTLVETSLVLRKYLGFDPADEITAFLDEYGITIVEFTANHWSEASRAVERFGRGRHPAKLNFGDCLTYAVAKLADQPLLYVGDDFTKTDLRAA